MRATSLSGTNRIQNEIEDKLWLSLCSSYMFDTGLAIHEIGKIEKDNTISYVNGYITFTLYSRIVQLKYSKANDEYDVRLKIGISSESFMKLGLYLIQEFLLFKMISGISMPRIAFTKTLDFCCRSKKMQTQAKSNCMTNLYSFRNK